MTEMGKHFVRRLKKAAEDLRKGKAVQVTVFCPKCGHRKRARMSPIRLFGTQKCPSCEHQWIPPRKERGL